MTYETRHSFVAAFLNYCGLVLMEVRRTGPKSLTFIFQDDDAEAAQLETDFWEDRQVISARKLLEADREVRQEIWQAKNA